jgi:hypothetical protein
MAWANDLAALLGIPAGAASLAVAFYAACSAADKSARPEALKQISLALQSSAWTKTALPSAIIDRVFEWTFGERQFSFKCITRSVLASIIFVVCAALIVHAHIGKWPSIALTEVTNLDLLPFLAMLYLIAGLIPDYIALAKTRVLLRSSHRTSHYFAALLIADLFLSVIISYIFLEISSIPENILKAGNISEIGFVRALWESLLATGFTYIYDAIDAGEPTWFFTTFSDGEYPFAILLFSSTVLTSIWMLFVWLSGNIIKIANHLQRVSVWFFDVERHPVQALGAVSACLIMTIGFIWSAVRALLLIGH